MDSFSSSSVDIKSPKSKIVNNMNSIQKYILFIQVTSHTLMRPTEMIQPILQFIEFSSSMV